MFYICCQNWKSTNCNTENQNSLFFFKTIYNISYSTPLRNAVAIQGEINEYVNFRVYQIYFTTIFGAELFFSILYTILVIYNTIVYLLIFVLKLELRQNTNFVIYEFVVLFANLTNPHGDRVFYETSIFCQLKTVIYEYVILLVLDF